MKLTVLIFGALFAALPALAQKPTTIRVAPLVSNYPMKQGRADEMTAKLIAHLTAAGVSVVEGKSDIPTDAILKVACDQRAGAYIEGPVRLTDTHGRVIWADEVRGRSFAHDAEASFAEAVAIKVEMFLFKQQNGGK
jgi:hypothetical protein